MKDLNKYLVLGVMTGTSMDGIDLSLIKTDGINYVKNVPLQRGKTLTINICMASIRSGLIKHGEGTPIYEQLRKSGYLKQALLILYHCLHM